MMNSFTFRGSVAGLKRARALAALAALAAGAGQGFHAHYLAVLLRQLFEDGSRNTARFLWVVLRRAPAVRHRALRVLALTSVR